MYWDLIRTYTVEAGQEFKTNTAQLVQRGTFEKKHGPTSVSPSRDPDNTWIQKTAFLNIFDKHPNLVNWIYLLGVGQKTFISLHGPPPSLHNQSERQNVDFELLTKSHSSCPSPRTRSLCVLAE